MSAVLVAQEFWGEDLPDWVLALARACDLPGASQRKVGDRIGYTGSVISQVLRNAYGARLDAIEERVRAVYLGGLLDCPARGEIPSEACLNWRDKSRELRSSSPVVVRMFRACNACPRNQKQTEEEAL